ncbi:hypothetical protein [Novosphingobium sp. CECT 9465]|uniref:hypothetical protein n=1 Tax=Novosphingobium sp. CECT 9465 TaxID=2829794 RepID=UPI001E64CD3D|nr:hypothetical protein [Novosphingobium sp. CECT 9465]CAH0495275.1 hypothetical protein NVSP9465_00281 [Novosphingobium sp. CECT 9465]
MNDLAAIENRSTICRVTCGWKKESLPLEVVRRYWRDVHSPSIARRDGIHDYRHFQYDPVVSDLFAPVAGITFACPQNEQLMWTSDVRYRDEAGLEAFGKSPPRDVLPGILGDIDLIVDQSTTYKALGTNAWTYKDATGIAMPQGLPASPTYQLFLRQKGDEASFRAALRALVESWQNHPAVIRARLSLFDVPDMEAERKAGYPVKTHPVERQYQAWIDLVVTDPANAAHLLGTAPGLADHVHTIHAYPVTTLCTFNYDGRPTLAGLRGFPAWDALTSLGGYHQAAPEILEWMYGDVAKDVTLPQGAAQ